MAWVFCVGMEFVMCAWTSCYRSDHINIAVMGLKEKCTNVQGGPPNPYRLTVFYLTLKCPVRTCQLCWCECVCVYVTMYILKSFGSDNLEEFIIITLFLCICLYVSRLCTFQNWFENAFLISEFKLNSKELTGYINTNLMKVKLKWIEMKYRSKGWGQ